MIDQVTLAVHGGNGGRGVVAFRRTKFVPLGGPDGGAGGHGGHVWVAANAQISTLNRYRRQQTFRAENGAGGGPKDRHGRAGEDLVLEVPVGTTVTPCGAEGRPLEEPVDLQEDGQVMLAARGGRGGHGNAFFKSATNRAPRIAQKGEPGTQVWLRLDQRLIADVGIVGLANAGKSTLLRALSAAHPRIGDYPFTTLEPVLGVAAVGWRDLVVADLPGLVEGAAAGLGLGHAFLRHATRTRLLIHLIDGGQPAPSADYDRINHELAAYSADLAAKPQIVVINKIDRDEVRSRIAEIETVFARRGITPLFISAAIGEGTERLVEQCAQRVQEQATEQVRRPEPRVLKPPADPRRYSVIQEAPRHFRVSGRQVEAFVQMMDLEDPDGRDETYRWLARRGVVAALRRAGVKPGDVVKVGNAQWEWEA